MTKNLNIFGGRCVNKNKRITLLVVISCPPNLRNMLYSCPSYCYLAQPFFLFLLDFVSASDLYLKDHQTKAK